LYGLITGTDRLKLKKYSRIQKNKLFSVSAKIFAICGKNCPPW
jgi:hypothetical protein